MFEVCGAGGKIKTNTRYRLLVRFKDQLCPIVRFAVSRDGSVNFSPYLSGASEVATQVLESSANGTVSVEYGKGVVTPKAQLPGQNILKVNYHASGHVHYGLDKAYAEPIRGLTKPTQIAVMLLMHPREMGLIEREAIRPSDMVTGFMVDEGKPIYVEALIAPSGTPLPMPSPSQQKWTQLLQLSGLNGAPDYCLIFHVMESAPGPWPPECGVLIRGSKTPPSPNPP